jgi:hypothetical protein
MTRNEDTTKEFQNQMNSLNASMKFELELPSNDNTLKLLDFHLRMISNPMTEINRHLLIKILTNEKDSINLRIKEALLIKELHPELNIRNELNELRMLM